MRNTKLMVIRKLDITDIASETETIRGTARKFKFNLIKFKMAEKS